MRSFLLGVFLLSAATAHAEEITGARASPPALSLDNVDDQTLAQKLVDALNEYSGKVTACAVAINPDAPEEASSVCVCKYPKQLADLSAQLAEVEVQRPAWIGHIIHVISPRDGMATSLALPHLRAQVDGLSCK